VISSIGREWLRRIRLDSIFSAAVRARLMPLLAQFRRRWLEAGERLVRKPARAIPRAAVHPEPARRRRLKEIRATRTPLRTPAQS
jgi:hypothetical protein